MGTLITSIDDLELDASRTPLKLWHEYLASPTSDSAYSSLGWCLPADPFSLDPTACCAPASGSASPPAPAAPSIDHNLCFARTDAESTACLPALPLFPPSRDVPARCLADESCSRGQTCAKIRDSEGVLRVGVRGGGGAEGAERTVIWQGDRRSVLAQG